MMTYVAPPPDPARLLEGLAPGDLARLLRSPPPDPNSSDEYVHWDKLRHLDPPEGLTHEEWWLRIKVGRGASARPFPLASPEGVSFTYSLPDSVLRLLHHVDQRCGREIAMSEVVTADAQAKQHYLVNSLMEEAIRSSQLEGATTSRRVAKELLRTGRAPANRSERMISNNYAALQFMLDMGDELTPSLVLEVQRIVTEGTLEHPEAAGRLQRPGEERVAALDRRDGTALHAPPPAAELRARLEAMCAFANADLAGDGRFVHPVVRAVLLHFWLGYDHPFEDGNGRTARALFYWYLRTRGYRLVEYLSISRILREAPAKYSRAYLLTESDEGDTTYFLLYHLQVVERAIAELHRYLRRKMGEVRKVEQLLKGASDFNHRQLALLGDALRTHDRLYTFGGHASCHGVTHETARSDVSALADLGLLERRQHGRRYSFAVPDDLASRLQTLGSGEAPTPQPVGAA